METVKFSDEFKNNDPEYLDQASDVRNEENLDWSIIESFLKDSISGLEGKMTVRQFKGGHSNLTYLISFQNKEMILRRPPFGSKARTAHDMGREFSVLKALNTVYPYFPGPIIYSEQIEIMGSPFYVMDRIKGIVLRKNIPEGLSLSAEKVNLIFRNVVKAHHELHCLDYRAIGLENFGKPEGYVRRQIEGWSKRYRAAKTPDAPCLESVMSWLCDNQPDDSASPCLIHNDFKFDNIVLDAGDPLKVIGVLDWEMATIGDPLMDLGCSLGYWVEKDDSEEMQALRTIPTHMDGAMTRRQMVDYYAEISGFKIHNFEFYRAFGLFRLAVIAQQIYYRFYHGQTKDKRFQMLIFAVSILEKEVLKLLGK